MNRHQQAVQAILDKLTNSYEANHRHPYLEDNDVGAFDLSLDDDGNLLGVGVDLKASFNGASYIPKPRNLLTINPYGESSLEPGARVAGAALMIGHSLWRRAVKIPMGRPELYVAVDYATGAFLYENLNRPVAVAFRPSNVKSVVEILRAKFPRSTIVVCLNNEKGKEVIRDRYVKDVRKFNAIAVYPNFTDEERYNSLVSFNDQAMFSSPEETVKALLAQIGEAAKKIQPPPPLLKPETTDSYGDPDDMREIS